MAMPDPIAAEAGTIQIVPLDRLTIHPLNGRTEPPPADIRALADSILTIGLLQNLMGYDDPLLPGQIGIVAGGRRLRALQMLAAEGHQLAVEVRVTDDRDTARLWASAENAARQALSPADEVEAYSRMAEAGADLGTISVAFAVTTRHVQQRLRLARLPAPALDALRTGRITLDQAAALTVAQSDEALLAALTQVLTSTWHTSPNDIRGKLLNATIRPTDRKAVFVGVDAYRAAGGAVHEDLFQDSVRLLDGALLDTLFVDRLEAAAEAERARGWAKVVVWLENGVPFEATRGLVSVQPVPVDLPDGDLDELDALQQRGEAGEDMTDAELARWDELETRAAGDYADDDVAASTVWMYVAHDGDLRRFGPYRARAAEAGDDDTVTASGGGVKPESRALSASVMDDLHRIRLAALQVQLAAQPELALDLLAWRMSGTLKPWSQPLAVSPTLQQVQPEKPEGFEAPDWMADRRTDGDENSTPAGFAAFRALGKKHRNTVLTRATARCLVSDREIAPALAQMLDPDPRAIWTPTATGYLSRLPAPVLDAIWCELVPDAIWCELVPDDREPTHAAFRALKKGDKAKTLHRLFNDADFREAVGLSRDQCARIDAWLPAEMQWPAVEGATDQPATTGEAA